MQNYRLEPSDKLCAWTVADLARENSWQYNLTDGDIVELQTALDSVKRRKLGVPDIASKDFPIRGFGEKLRDILDELEEGRGVFLIRGLPMERYSKQDAGTIFWESVRISDVPWRKTPTAMSSVMSGTSAKTGRPT